MLLAGNGWVVVHPWVPWTVYSEDTRTIERKKWLVGASSWHEKQQSSAVDRFSRLVRNQRTEAVWFQTIFLDLFLMEGTVLRWGAPR